MLKKFTNLDVEKFKLKRYFFLMIILGIIYSFLSAYLKFSFSIKLFIILSSLVWSFLKDFRHRFFYASLLHFLFPIPLFKFKVFKTPITTIGIHSFHSADILFFAFFLFVLRDFLEKKSHKDIFSFAIFLMWWGYLLGTIVSHQKLYFLTYWLSMLGGYLIYKYLLFNFENLNQTRLIFLILFVFVLIACLHGLAVHFKIIPAPVEESYQFRARAFFANPNALGAMIAFFTPLLICYTLAFNTYWLLYFLPFYFLALLLTFSRSSYLAFISGLIVLTFLIRRKHRKSFQILAFSLFSVLLFLLTYSPTLYRILSSFSLKEDIGIICRLKLWNLSIKLFLHSPIWGNGDFPTFCVKSGLYTFGDPHNLYLHLLSTMGLIGFTSWILLFVSIFKGLKSAIYCEDKKISFLAIGFICSWICFLIHNFFSIEWTRIAHSTEMRILWINLGLTNLIIQWSRK